MQTKYYLTFEQVGVIRRIPIKEQDPDMQGILDAFTEAFRIANEMSDDDKVNTIDLINALQHCDTIYIDTVEIYEEGFEMIEQKVPLGDAGQCVRKLLDIIKDKKGTEKAAQELVEALQGSWAIEEKEGPIPPKYVDQFLTQVINLVWSKLKD